MKGLCTGAERDAQGKTQKNTGAGMGKWRFSYGQTFFRASSISVRDL